MLVQVLNFEAKTSKPEPEGIDQINLGFVGQIKFGATFYERPRFSSKI